jgi:OFA family oxalate/formate antiporter-like MFS transporter
VAEALRTPQWWALWALLFLNVNAGIAILSQAAPMAEEITGVSAAAAGGSRGTGRRAQHALGDHVPL